LARRWWAPQGLEVEGGKLAGHSGKVWVGGDCAAGGEDLTVTAVAEGRDAAEAIHAALSGR
jgi:dihydropyrimidine dehydrogenase (NAD+) subunit PreT